MIINIKTIEGSKRQVTLEATQTNAVEWQLSVFDCLQPVDISELVISFKIYDIMGALVLDLPIFALTEAQTTALRASKYRYTLMVGDFTYFFGELIINAI